jgi:hypothetical protein
VTDGPTAAGSSSFSGFSGLVRTPQWRATVDDWVGGVLTVAGMEPTGVGEQRRIRPWSTQIVVPTSTGRVWFKANAPGLAHEPALHAALARMAPDRVDAPLGIDVARGWMLTRDRGSTLADHHTPSLDEWFEIVQEAADLQRRVASEAGGLLATGMPDCSPATVPARFDRLLDLYAGLDPSHPSHLSQGERRAFEAVRGQVEEAAETLAECPLPVTLDHGDLHPGNVLLVDGGLRLFDFGDAQWASAPETLGAMWGWIVQRTEHSSEQIFAAYAEVWSDLVTLAEFDALVGPAMVTLPVNRSMTWWEATSGSTQEELVEWGEAPLSQLRHLLRPWP